LSKIIPEQRCAKSVNRFRTECLLPANPSSATIMPTTRPASAATDNRTECRQKRQCSAITTRRSLKYVKDKLLNNLALQEGGHALPQSIVDTRDRTVAYEYKKTTWYQSEAASPSPFGVWYSTTAYAHKPKIAVTI